jgi:hypothetical protein
VPVSIKAAVRRPGANEGGREEEENRAEIAAKRVGSPHNRKTVGTRPVLRAGDADVRAHSAESSALLFARAHPRVTRCDSGRVEEGSGMSDVLVWL